MSTGIQLSTTLYTRAHLLYNCTQLRILHVLLFHSYSKKQGCLIAPKICQKKLMAGTGLLLLIRPNPRLYQSLNPAVWIFDSDPGIEIGELKSLSATQEHVSAMLRVRIRTNISIHGTLPLSQKSPMHFLPHINAMLNVIFPTNIQSVKVSC